MTQAAFSFYEPSEPQVDGRYRPVLTVTENRKGVLDADTVKGCEMGMRAYPNGGCYGECYANKIAHMYGFDFTVSVSRKIMGREHRGTLIRLMNTYPVNWYRIGTGGDPCHDWDGTLVAIRALRHSKKTPVIITKHWIELSDEQLSELASFGAVINTSTSGLDTDGEIVHRVKQIRRIKSYGIRSVNRVVTCDFTDSAFGRSCKDKQDYLLSLNPVIDNPLRTSSSNSHVLKGDILVAKRRDSVGGGKLVSINHTSVAYLGTCVECPDQCGVVEPQAGLQGLESEPEQISLFVEKVEFKYVPSVIGSGYEQYVSTLALEDGIAHRAARKNMQIHSAIILTINEQFAGFMTFQNNHIAKEFCLLQSVIRPDKHTDDLYRQMVLAVIAQNTSGYPALITTDPKSKFETPELFESVGFRTYLKMSGFHYMVHGQDVDIRMKILAHITMCNVWDSTKGTWLKLKKEWKERIEQVGVVQDIINPMYATRDGCWQGTSGFANVVTGHSHNGNASVLDSVACEVILRFFMPTTGRRIYNPFGGGVQFGYVAGAYGYEYLASEIRHNQCDANNKLCSEFKDVRWAQGDSQLYEPDGMFDLVFSCPPYFKVEKYLDYDGNPPPGEINSFSTYEEFRGALFSGYRIAIDHLNENRFFVVMTGDSRDKNGAYYCSESETELFFKDNGLSVYNKIIYLEGEFTRLAQAKKTLNMRKFPKREQKIIVAYKGDISSIKDIFPPIGRL
jgi:hypothetical protein